ncbi:nitroreductase [Aestuariirhabdus litorea]|uniref:Nitroreductase n=1 Tax=Aestuariirhabdus litorea TaxID=2528527 RepID=A0A3P3VKR7_9GAMM|nr:nitroreductase [Aestuariirhabdus litorea]RRJ82974.1 nitroreductase [Aestuariirhabdus litorea]RWW93134.1 nitroreductase [Endozoicomonadaceae bacterium GTF-13]
MPLYDLIQSRRTVRGFTERLIEPQLLRQLFDQARQSPSNCNTQPWHTYVVSGQRCRQLAEQLYAHVCSGHPPQPDFGFMASYEGVFRERQVACAQALYRNLGIAREDKAGRMQALLDNYRFFGAPHVAFIGMPRSYHTVNAVDIGIYAQTLMLLMTEQGIASCPQGALAYYPELVRRELGIDPEVGLLLGISFGYEDSEHPANKTRTDRAPLDENTRFLD